MGVNLLSGPLGKKLRNMEYWNKITAPKVQRGTLAKVPLLLGRALARHEIEQTSRHENDLFDFFAL